MKTMKKSMFLTTVLMVVLLVVALSTATFAWYTTNTNVTATKTQVVSASSNSASLVIDGAATADPNATSSSVTLVMNQNIAPMLYAVAPSGEPATVHAPVYGTTTYADFIASFKTFTVDYSNTKFASTVGEGTPATLTSVTGDNAGTAIFLSNIGGRAMSSITAKVTIENYSYTVFPTTPDSTPVTGKYVKGDNDVYSVTEDSTAVEGTTYYTRSAQNNKMCVALFSGAPAATNAEMKLAGVFSNLATMQVGNATALAAAQNGDAYGTAVGGVTFSTKAAAGVVASENLLSADLAQGSAIKVFVVAWFEGVGMTNDIAGTGANFSIAFDATAA